MRKDPVNWRINQHASSMLAVMQGLEAGIHRQIVFTGLRVGLYGSILDMYDEGHSRDDAALHARVGAAMTTSAIGITLANPSGGSPEHCVSTSTSALRPCMQHAPRCICRCWAFHDVEHAPTPSSMSCTRGTPLVQFVNSRDSPVPITVRAV